MRLKKVQVRDFRCIEDSGEFSVDAVTCLVGKNESGKTALLKALYKIKPDDEKIEIFEPARDYPRRKWKPGTPVPGTPPAITTAWDLDDTEWAVLQKKFGKGGITNRTFTLTKSYDNVRRYSISINEKAIAA